MNIRPDAERQPRAIARSGLHILLLYDDGSTHVSTIAEHIEAFRQYSRHDIVLMSATGPGPAGSAAVPLNFNGFDAIYVHFSVRVSTPDHLTPAAAAAVAAYQGPKVLFIQDEYENTETARGWIERLGIDTIFTNVPLDEIEKVYPKTRFPDLTFVLTLTGYVPEDPALDDYARPLSERPLLLGYRGRQLPYHYGLLGQDKWRIGFEMKRIASEHGIAADIEVDDDKRIYGNAWYRFVASCRAMLGTESGANVFDDDGTLKQIATEPADLTFLEFAATWLIGREGEVRMNQVSPKIFEAIRLRTALVLFEGSYSGVVVPDRHYIPLAHDFSNVDTVFAKLRDLDYLRDLTERAYRDIIESGKYSYRTFIEGVDNHLDRYGLDRPRARIISVPMFAIHDGEDGTPRADLLWHPAWPGAGGADIILDRSTRHMLRAVLEPPPEANSAECEDPPSGKPNPVPDIAQLRKSRVPGIRWLLRQVRRLRGMT